MRIGIKKIMHSWGELALTLACDHRCCVGVCFVFVLLQFSGFGFPSKPSAVAHDPYLDLLAIGTKSGALKLYPCVWFFCCT